MSQGDPPGTWRLRRLWPIVLLAACAVVIAALALTVGGPEPAPSERAVERRLSAIAARAGQPLRVTRCVRDAVLPRTFTCVGEGPFDMHVALRVRWLSGDLDVRRPDGSRVRF